MKDYKFYYLPVAQKDKNGKIFYMPKPIISVGINFKRNNPIIIEALLDSGADHNLLPGYLGDILKIPVKKGKTQTITGIGGIKIERIWQTIKKDLPELKTLVERLLDKEQESKKH